LLINKAPIEAFKALVVGEQVTREMLEDCRFINRVYAAMVGKIAARREQLKQQLEKTKAEWDTVRQSSDKELRRQKLFAMNQAHGTCRWDEERGKYEMKAVLAYIRIWAQNKAENRMGWLQALNRVVCNGERSSGSILFLAFPQELILKLADRTGGKPVRVHVPRLYEGLVRTDSSGRTFLVPPVNPCAPCGKELCRDRDLPISSPEFAKGLVKDFGEPQGHDERRVARPTILTKIPN